MSSRHGYNDFLHGAQEAFGLTWGEARELYRDMQDALGFNPSELGRDALSEFYDVADTLVERFYERPEFEEEVPPEEVSEAVREVEEELYELDPFFPDDDWLDADEEWELTAEYEEGSE